MFETLKPQHPNIQKPSLKAIFRALAYYVTLVASAENPYQASGQYLLPTRRSGQYMA